VGQELLDLLGGLDPGALGHADVHQDHVRHQLLGLLDRLDAVGGLSDYLDVRLVLEDHLQAAPEQRVVVADHYAEALRPLGLSGSPAPLGHRHLP
jgi:hypothetical protein